MIFQILHKDGETSEIVLEELKKYDLLVLVKSEKVTPVFKGNIKKHFQTINYIAKCEGFQMGQFNAA